mmetsp:Transcript_140084/g.349100  ORF Transcript_140084/g.349100 Transcript_140084/m.349100 type:complete len:639 (-) Transcript_140084:114-2030(-)
MACASYGAVPELEHPTQRPINEVIAPFVSESIGTFLLVFTTGVCGIAGNADWNATVVASIFMVMVYAFGPISGGHLNPAVSVAFGLMRAIPWRTVGGYILAQVLGAALAGCACYGVFDSAVAIGPKNDFGWFQVAIVEIVYTAMLCFVFLNCVVSTKNNPKQDQNSYYGLAAGFVMIAGGYAAGHISGAVLNPATAIGLDLLGAAPDDGERRGWWRALYVVVQLLGACLAVLLFRLCRRRELLGGSATGVGAEPGTNASLHLRVLAAYNLKRDPSMPASDTTDPYIVARIGPTEYRTPSMRDNANPIWISDNVFIFNLVGASNQLTLEVMDESNRFENQSLGSCGVDLRELQVGQWERRRDRVSEVSGGEIEFDVRLDAAVAAAVPQATAAESGFNSKLLSEFIGTFVLVFTFGLNLVMKESFRPWSVAAALMCMTYSLASVSGAHFNPAVTLAVVLSRRGKCPAGDGFAFVMAQLSAGTLAGFLASHFHSAGPYKQEVFGIAPGESTQSPGSVFPWLSVFAAEALFTFMLAIVVLATSTVAPPKGESRQNFYSALAIGSCFTAGGFAILAVSGGELNPAVSFGVATVGAASNGSNGAFRWDTCLIYSVFELAGGVFAAVAFAFTHSTEYYKPASPQF